MDPFWGSRFNTGKPELAMLGLDLAIAAANELLGQGDSWTSKSICGEVVATSVW